jgi:hypothetical protein
MGLRQDPTAAPASAATPSTPWLDHYNHHRPHAITPAAKLNNLLGNDTYWMLEARAFLGKGVVRTSLRTKALEIQGNVHHIAKQAMGH